MFQLRGAYAILPHEMRIIQLILGGNLKVTKENLRVTPGSFPAFRNDCTVPKAQWLAKKF